MLALEFRVSKTALRDALSLLLLWLHGLPCHASSAKSGSRALNESTVDMGHRSIYV